MKHLDNRLREELRDYNAAYHGGLRAVRALECLLEYCEELDEMGSMLVGGEMVADEIRRRMAQELFP
jgi:hypothetical protein